MNADPLDVPQSGLDDIGHIAATTIISLIPFIGAAEIFKAAVPPPMEKRRDKWMQDVGNAIRELSARKGFEIEDLRNNDEFTTLLIQTTQAAFKTHLDTKRALLKNALVNAMSLDMDFDSKQLYMGMVERFSPTHISILSLINRAKHHTRHATTGGQFYDKLKEYGEVITLSLNGITFLGFLEDLHKAGLLAISDDFIISDGDVRQVQTRVSNNRARTTVAAISLTDLGYGFLNFID